MAGQYYGEVCVCVCVVCVCVCVCVCHAHSLITRYQTEDVCPYIMLILVQVWFRPFEKGLAANIRKIQKVRPRTAYSDSLTG